MSNEKTRIFCLITQGEMGGAQQFVIQLAHHLNHEKFDLHIVWGSDSHGALARQLPAHVTHSVAHYLVRAISPWYDLRAVWELRRMMRHYRPDVVLCISSKAGFVGSWAAHKLRSGIPDLRVIYRIGGWTFNDPWPKWKKRCYIMLERLSAHWKNYIVVNNTHDLDQARMLGIKPRNQILRIYNGIDPYLNLLSRTEAHDRLTEKMPERYRDLPYDYTVGTIANFYPAKDLVTFVRAAARVSANVRFVIIGDGDLRPQLEKQIQEYDLHKRFFLLGRISDAYKYLPAFDVFTLSSVKEGFPWAVLEAMAAKIPIVATRVGAVPEILEDQISGLLVQPSAADEMAHAIVKLLGDDRMRQDLAIAAHQQLITHFSLRSMINQFERLFVENSTLET